MSEIIEMLHNAAREEHAAVIQYLRHAYMMGEGEEACEIEAIARDEMRHFWMLSRWVVKLGGKPTLQRGKVDTSGATVSEWMERDRMAEERAIEMYRDYIARIQDPALKADLERILADEEHHHSIFIHLAEKLTSVKPSPESPEAVQPAASEKETLDWSIRHEYAAILQYLYHSFLIQDEEISRQLELQAINEMQHMGWLAEEFVSSGGEMPLEHFPVELPEGYAAMLEADIRFERDTVSKYDDFLSRIADENLRELLSFIRNHELYHEGLFTRLLERLKVTSTGWTIGSLKDKR